MVQPLCESVERLGNPHELHGLLVVLLRVEQGQTGHVAQVQVHASVRIWIKIGIVSRDNEDMECFKIKIEGKKTRYNYNYVYI